MTQPTDPITHIVRGALDRAGATLLAAVILRMRVNYRMDTPTLADCILLNAALHLEGRHAEVEARTQW